MCIHCIILNRLMKKRKTEINEKKIKKTQNDQCEWHAYVPAIQMTELHFRVLNILHVISKHFVYCFILDTTLQKIFFAFAFTENCYERSVTFFYDIWSFFCLNNHKLTILAWFFTWIKFMSEIWSLGTRLDRCIEKRR